MKQTDNNYILDCFRILALFMVLSVHIKDHLLAAPRVFSEMLSLGAYGVALYFLIAGYFAYLSVKKEKDIQAYAYKKAIRILPMYYISLALTFVVGTIVKLYPIDFRWLYHVVFLNMMIPSPQWEWWHSVNYFWTMPAFIAWYILSPIIFRWIDCSHKAAGMALLTSIATPFLKEWMYTFASEQFVNWNFFCLLYVFLFGVLAYFVDKEKCFWTGMLYGFMIGVIGLAAGNRSGFFVFGLAFYFAVIIANTLPISWNCAKTNQFIKKMSAVTYSVYLSHWFILTVGKPLWRSLPWMISYIGFMGIAWGTGYLAYRYIEKPIYSYLHNRASMKT